MVPGRIRKIQTDPDGYLKVSLSKAGKSNFVFVHRMVLETFVGPPPEPGLLALHDNGVKADVYPENLYWGTNSDNMLDHYRRHGGVHPMSRVQECPRGHLLRDPNLFESDKKLNRRGCKSCQCTHRVRDGLTWGEFLEKADAKYREITGLEPNYSASGRSPKVAI